MKYFGILGGLFVLIVLGLVFWYKDILQDFYSGISPIVTPAPEIGGEGEALPFVVPEGFAVSLFAEGVPGARVLTRDPRGALVLSQTSEGRVVALPDQNGDGKADKVIPILTGLHNPHGIVFRCGELGVPTDAGMDGCLLYVAESDAVNVYEYDADLHTATFIEEVAALPDDGGHHTRTLMLHPDGRQLLVSVGSSCNVCDEDDERRSAVLSIDTVTKEWKVFARGLRNTVFMALNPVDGEIWGTENGRDLLGDDLPPDEINIIEEGASYGWPICYGQNVHDTEFDTKTYIRNPCMEPFEKPAHIDLQAHSAPLGLAFIPEEGWPEHMRLDLLVAYHGSWNRSVPTGYKIVRIDLLQKGSRADYVGEPQDFMTGFMAPSGEVIGRPVALLVEPGGTVYVSDDRQGMVYRVSRIEPGY